MSASLNEVQLIGNLAADPEVRRLNSGDQVVSMRIATSETWRDKNSGDRKERTEWHSIVIFNDGIGKIAEQYCKKGSRVFIRGAIQTRKWQDQSGADRYTTEIVLQKYQGMLVLLSDRSAAGTQYQHDPDRPIAGTPSHARPKSMNMQTRDEDPIDEVPF